MLLKDLEQNYPLVYKQLKLQSRIQSTSIHWLDLRADVNNSLIWSDTEEGPEFWASVQRGDIESAKELAPHLFSTKKLPYKIVTNGLFK